MTTEISTLNPDDAIPTLSVEPTKVICYGRILAQYLPFDEKFTQYRNHQRNIFLIEGVELPKLAELGIIKTGGYKVGKTFHNINARVAIPYEIVDQMVREAKPETPAADSFSQTSNKKVKPTWWGALEFEVDYPCNWEPAHYDRRLKPRGNRVAHIVMPRVPVSKATYLPNVVMKLCSGNAALSLENAYEWAQAGFDPSLVVTREEESPSGNAIEEALQTGLQQTDDSLAAVAHE